MQLTQLLQQTSTTSQCNNYHLTKHTHIPKRPCFLYPASFLEIRFFFFTREQPSTSQIFLGSLPKLSKLFSLHSTVSTGSRVGCNTPKLRWLTCFTSTFATWFSVHCIALHCIVLYCGGGGHGRGGLAPSGDHCSIRHHRGTCSDFFIVFVIDIKECRKFVEPTRGYQNCVLTSSSAIEFVVSMTTNDSQIWKTAS